MPTLQGFLPRLGIFQDVVQVIARLNSKNLQLSYLIVGWRSVLALYCELIIVLPYCVESRFWSPATWPAPSGWLVHSQPVKRFPHCSFWSSASLHMQDPWRGRLDTSLVALNIEVCWHAWTRETHCLPRVYTIQEYGEGNLLLPSKDLRFADLPAGSRTSAWKTRLSRCIKAFGRGHSESPFGAFWDWLPPTSVQLSFSKSPVYWCILPEQL